MHFCQIVIIHLTKYLFHMDNLEIDVASQCQVKFNTVTITIPQLTWSHVHLVVLFDVHPCDPSNENY